MFSILTGLVAAGAAVGGLVYFRPRNGVTHRLATSPVLDTIIPIAIVSGLAVGVAMIVAGAVALR